MKKILFWVTALLLTVLLQLPVSAEQLYYEILTAIWLAPDIGKTEPVVKTFIAPSNYMNLSYTYSGPTYNSTNHPTYPMLKIEKIDANGNSEGTIVNLKKPLPSNTMGRVLPCIPGGTYRVSIFDNGNHIRGKRRPWVVIYYEYWK